MTLGAQPSSNLPVFKSQMKTHTQLWVSYWECRFRRQRLLIWTFFKKQVCSFLSDTQLDIDAVVKRGRER